MCSKQGKVRLSSMTFPHKILSKIFKSLTSNGVEAVVDDVVIDGTTAWPTDGFLTNNSAPLYLALNLGGEPLGVILGAEFYLQKKLHILTYFFKKYKNSAVVILKKNVCFI